MPQFFTSLAILSGILVISQLMRITEVLVTFGFTLENFFLPILFIVLPFMTFTIPMAYLFAVLIGFSRLSADGEYTALLAAGFSLKRAAQPVLAFAALLVVAAAMCAVLLEPWGRRELVSFYHRKAQGELDNVIRVKLQPGVFLEDFLGFVLYVEKISEDRTHFENVMLAPRTRPGQATYAMLAPTGSITGSVESNDLRMSFYYGMIYSGNSANKDVSVSKFKTAEIDLLRVFQQQITGSAPDLSDYRALGPLDLWEYINSLKSDLAETPNPAKSDILRKASYLFHQRLALPFTAIIFALIAMVLGIQDQRRGKGGVFASAILTIVLCYVFMMSFDSLTKRGWLTPWLAAWVPVLIVGLCASFLVYQRNRLPASEGTLDPRNIPYINRFLAKR